MRAVGRVQVRALAFWAVAVAAACGETVGGDEGRGDPTVDGGGSPDVGTAPTDASEPEGGAISDASDDASDADAADAVSDASDADAADAVSDASDADAALPGDGSAPDAALPDDACPEKLDVNCSTSCGGLMNCNKGCYPSTLEYYGMSAASGSFVLRMPSSPAALKSGQSPPICNNGCVNGSLGMNFRIVTDAPKARVRVDPPWFLACGNSCATFAPLSGPNAFYLTVYTEDPNAPARNVVIEATSDSCTP